MYDEKINKRHYVYESMKNYTIIFPIDNYFIIIGTIIFNTSNN